MQVMTKANEKLMEELLELAGSTSVLERAFRLAQQEHGEQTTVAHVVDHIVALRKDELEPA